MYIYFIFPVLVGFTKNNLATLLLKCFSGKKERLSRQIGRSGAGIPSGH
jgi:hypothetical protein